MDENDGRVPASDDAPHQGPRRSRARAIAVVGAGAALAIGLFAGGAAWSIVWQADTLTTTTTDTTTGSTLEQDQDSAASRTPGDPPDGTFPGQGQSDESWGSTTDGTSLGTTAATGAQQIGLVTIVTTLSYQDAQAAGTGIVLTADGEILTNNHVIEGATEVEVTVESTGVTYVATVVGTDATADVAVLQLTGASGLATAAIDADAVTVGETITAVGNAEGNGDLLAAAGTVTALEQSITTQSEGVTAGQDLVGLLQIDADVVSGDSGGAVLDADGEVVGMTTAASSGRSDIVGYAISIDDALAVVAQIEAGLDTDALTIGYPGFLGIQLSGIEVGAAGAGAAVAGVYADTPAADAGLVAGDVITALDGVVVDSPATLGTLIGGYSPGDEVSVSWTAGATGATQTALVTLIVGPAD